MGQNQISNSCNKGILLWVFLVLHFCGQSQAQVLNHDSNSLLVGDWLDKTTVSYHEEKEGSMYNWVIEPLEDSKNLVDKYIEEGDSIACISQGVRTYFSQTAQDIHLLGYETNQYKVHYDIPESYLHFPFMHESIMEGDFEGTGLYCDRLAFKQKGHFVTRMEKQGRIITESGDTIRHVMLLHTHRGSQLLSIEGDESLATFQEDEYRWYVPEYRYPILLRKDLYLKDASNSLCGTAEYYPLQVQTNLLANGDQSGYKDDRSKSNRSYINYSYVASMNGSTIHVGYSLKQESKLKILLVDSKGCLYKSMTQSNPAGEGYSFKIDCSGFPYGQYVLYVSVNGQTFTENFLIK